MKILFLFCISFSKDIYIFFFLLESDIWLEATMAAHSLTKLWRVGWKMFLWVEEKFSQNFFSGFVAHLELPSHYS